MSTQVNDKSERHIRTPIQENNWRKTWHIAGLQNCLAYKEKKIKEMDELLLRLHAWMVCVETKIPDDLYDDVDKYVLENKEESDLSLTEEHREAVRKELVTELRELWATNPIVSDGEWRYRSGWEGRAAAWLEEKNNNTHTIIKSKVVAVADVPNRNNRIYPKSVLENIVDDFQHQSPLNGDWFRMMGQLGTPEGTSVHLSEASHVVRNLRMMDNKLVCDIQVMDTPGGKMISALHKEGCDMKFRLHGTGSVEEEEGSYVVQDDYKLISVNALPEAEAS